MTSMEVDLLGEVERLLGETEIVPPDRRVRVTSTKQAPFRFICNFERKLANGSWRSAGTGTLIGPRTVLTAGHVVHGIQKSRLRVIPGRNGSTGLTAPCGIAGVEIFDGYAENSGTDLAIVHLVRPIGKTIGYWTRRHHQMTGDDHGTSILAGPLPLPAGRLDVNLSGYAADLPADPAYQCRPAGASPDRCAYTPLSAPGRDPVCGTYQYRSYDMTVERTKPRLLHYQNDTCPGHSGSPVWVHRDRTMGGRMLIAVHIGAGPRGNQAVLIDKDVLRFIIRYTK